MILFNLSGHGLLDLAGYEKYLSGTLESSQVSDGSIQESLGSIKAFPKAPARKSGKW